jgi:hypothetical protein
MKKPQKKNKLFILCLQNNQGQIQPPVLFYHNYDSALQDAMDLSKEKGSYWSIFNLFGRLVDSNFVSTSKKENVKQ